MDKNLKKILITGASLLMLSSIGAGLNQTNISVHASRLSRQINNLKAKKSRDYRDIKSINNQLKKLSHRDDKNHSYKKESANWFEVNAPKLYRSHYMNHKQFEKSNSDDYNTNFTYGYQTSRGNRDKNDWWMPDRFPSLDRALSKSDYTPYTVGWIIGFANNGRKPSRKNGGTTARYRYAINVYNSGRRFDAKAIQGGYDPSYFRYGHWNRNSEQDL